MKLISLVLVLGLLGCVQVKTPHRDLVVTAGDLMDNPAAFTGKNVIATGYWNMGFELSSFSDESHPYISVIWVNGPETDAAHLAESVRETLQKAGSSPDPQIIAGRLWIRCEARFEYNGGDSATGVGHLNAYRSQLFIMRILEARVVPLD